MGALVTGADRGTALDAQDVGDLRAEDDEGRHETAHADDEVTAVEALGGGSGRGRRLGLGLRHDSLRNDRLRRAERARRRERTRGRRLVAGGPCDRSSGVRGAGGLEQAPQRPAPGDEHGHRPEDVEQRRAEGSGAALPEDDGGHEDAGDGAEHRTPAPGERGVRRPHHGEEEEAGGGGGDEELGERHRLLRRLGGVLDAEADGLESAQRRLEAEDDDPPGQHAREPFEQAVGGVGQAEPRPEREQAQDRRPEQRARGHAGKATAEPAPLHGRSLSL